MKNAIVLLLLSMFTAAMTNGAEVSADGNVGASNESGASGSDPRMTAEERAKAVKLLLESQKEFFDAIEKVSDAQWSYQPTPFKWSVGLTAEHIVLTEERLFSVVQLSLSQKPNPDWEAKTAGKEQLLERVLPSRTGRAAAPVEIQPKGKLTRAELIARF